jgi:vesicle-fusing ATPase
VTVLAEVAIGGSAALLLFLAVQGINVFPVVAVGVLLFLLYYAVERRGELLPVRIGTPTPPPALTFEDIGGQEAAKRELKEALDFILQQESVRAMGIRPIKGILLVGPPGTGKTLLAKAAAGYTDAVFLAVNGSEFIEVYAGVGAQRVRGLFKRARQMAFRAKKNRAVIFIDEIDVLGSKRGTYQAHQEYDQTLNQLLVEMDGLRLNDGVNILVIGASNRADLLDPALLRPGRFDRIVRVDLPDKWARLEILQLHTRNKPLAPDVDLAAIAQETFGFSGAHLESVANEAAILALRDKAKFIGQRHFREAVDKVMLGEKLERRPTPEELYRIAVHESGHAVASEILQPGSISHVTITSRGNALGYIRQSQADDSYLMTKGCLEARIQICLGGAVAEELVLGYGSTGSVTDLQEAAKLARQYLGAGMGDYELLVLEDMPPSLQYRAIRRIIRQLKEQVRELLSANQSALVTLADCLSKEEMLTGEYVRAVLRKEGNGVQAPAS